MTVAITKSAQGFDALEKLTVNDLKKLTKLLVTSEKPTRKSDLIELIVENLSESRLPKLWDKLDTLQKNAVKEALYAKDRVFDAEKFRAKYGSSPNFGESNHYGYDCSPSMLQLFLYREGSYQSSTGGYHIPSALAEKLKMFVPKPEETRLATSVELPDFYEQVTCSYEWQDDDPGITIIHRSKCFRSPTKDPKVKTHKNQIPLTLCKTESNIQVELKTILKLIDQNKVGVSNKTFLASKATLKNITAVLQSGDYYPWNPDEKDFNTIGPIRAHAWPLLVQCAKLAEIRGSKLALTKSGRSALTDTTEKIVKKVWEKWLSNTLFDEFNRINHIKGQGGKGKRSMTKASLRRERIVQGLKQCPTGEWVGFNTFSRYLQASGLDYTVTRQYWDLYIGDQQYGSLGYDGYNEWHIIEGRYLLCFLFEYAATLGLIDVAYISPEDANPDYKDLWGADDLDFLSRYDGLCYFRLNELGAYCLGFQHTYVKSDVQTATPLTVSPNLNISLHKAKLTTEEEIILDIFANKVSEDSWKLDTSKIMLALESGHKIETLRQFLQRRDAQPLPETVEGLLRKCEKNASALKYQGRALVIECASENIAKQISDHKETKALCLRAGDKHLVVNENVEDRFRKKVNLLGLGIV